MRAVRLLPCAFVVLFPWDLLYGQSGPTPSIPIPSASGIFGRTDSGAAKELAQSVSAVGPSPWTAMHATGTISYGGDDSSYPATLTIVESSRYRLDAQTASGPLSIRINGNVGKIQGSDGKASSMARETSSLCIVQFAKLRLDDLKNSSAIIDHGNLKIDGMTLHRVTVENPLTANAKSQQESDGVVATDFYFTPDTHLLAMSTNTVKVSGVGNSLLRTIRYEDYRPVDGNMIPFRFTQILDGQKLWTFQVTGVQLNTSIQTTYFEF